MFDNSDKIKFLKRSISLLTVILFLFFVTDISFSQEIGWYPSTGVSGDKFSNRVHYQNYAKSGLSYLIENDKDLKVIVYPLGVNDEVKNKLPDFEQILMKKLLDNGATLNNSLFSTINVILAIQSFKVDNVIAFDIRLIVKNGSYLDLNDRDSMIPQTILWKDSQFGFVKSNQAEKIEDYVMDSINNLIKNLNMED